MKDSVDRIPEFARVGSGGRDERSMEEFLSSNYSRMILVCCSAQKFKIVM